MVYGAENYELVGQYAQAGCVAYVLAEIPMIFFWGFAIEKILALMQFSDHVIALADSYVWVVVVRNILSGVNEANLNLLEVVEREKYANIMYCISSLVHVGLVALFTFTVPCDLIMLGLLMLSVEAFFLFVNVLIPYLMWWYSPFEGGLFGSFVLFKEPAVVKEVLKTALPLSFGGVLAYAEWELLILFTACLGPAEIVAWTLLGSVWDVFESTTGRQRGGLRVPPGRRAAGARPALRSPRTPPSGA
jgi:Na+-driven multidrug efflux pump